jgi:hypothetical protein
MKLSVDCDANAWNCGRRFVAVNLEVFTPIEADCDSTPELMQKGELSSCFA